MVKILILLLLAGPVGYAQLFTSSNAARLRGRVIESPLSVADGCVLTWVNASSWFACSASGAGVTAITGLTDLKVTISTNVATLAAGKVRCGSLVYTVAATTFTLADGAATSYIGFNCLDAGGVPVTLARGANTMSGVSGYTDTSNVDLSSYGPTMIPIASITATDPGTAAWVAVTELRVLSSTSAPVAGDGLSCGVDVNGNPQCATDSTVTRNTFTVNAQTGTTYTYLDSDWRKLVTHTNGSAIAATLPSAAGAGFDSGWFMDVQNRGVGTLTITPTTSTIDGAASLALTTAQGVRIFSDGANYFTQRGIGGSGSSSVSINLPVGAIDSAGSYRASNGWAAQGLTGLSYPTSTNVSSPAGASFDNTGAASSELWHWIRIPSSYTSGAVQVKLDTSPEGVGGTNGEVARFFIKTDCVVAGQDLRVPTFGTPQAIDITYTTVARGVYYFGSLASLTMDSCSGGGLLQIALYRNSGDAADTLQDEAVVFNLTLIF
jgi:hypothetical protein